MLHFYQPHHSCILPSFLPSSPLPLLSLSRFPLSPVPPPLPLYLFLTHASDETEKLWFWNYEENHMYFELHEPVRFKVEKVTFNAPISATYEVKVCFSICSLFHPFASSPLLFSPLSSLICTSPFVLNRESHLLCSCLYVVRA